MLFKPTLHKLSNGVSVILDSMDVETAEIRLCFITGGRDETPDVYGITHFCEHMLCMGTKKMPSYQKLVDNIETKGGWFNAATSLKRIMFMGRIIAENLTVLLEQFADMIQNSLFDEKQIESERNAILAELNNEKNHLEHHHSGLIREFLLDSPAHRVQGTEQTIKSFTREQLLNWVHTRLSAKNCVIVVSGCINNGDELLKKLEKLFSFLPSHDITNNRDSKYTPCDKFIHEPLLKQVWLDILFPLTRPDIFENIRENLAEGKFHRYLSNQLFSSLRLQSGSFLYNIKVVEYGNGTPFGVHGIHTKTSIDHIEHIVAQIAQTAYDVHKNRPITDAVLQQYAMSDKLSDANFLESNEKRCSVLLNHYIDFGKLYDFYQMQKINQSITINDVVQASRGFFDGPMSIITFGTEHNIDLRKIWNDNFKQKGC